MPCITARRVCCAGASGCAGCACPRAGCAHPHADAAAWARGQGSRQRVCTLQAAGLPMRMRAHALLPAQLACTARLGGRPCISQAGGTDVMALRLASGAPAVPPARPFSQTSKHCRCGVQRHAAAHPADCGSRVGRQPGRRHPEPRGCRGAPVLHTAPHSTAQHSTAQHSAAAAALDPSDQTQHAHLAAPR